MLTENKKSQGVCDLINVSELINVTPKSAAYTAYQAAKFYIHKNKVKKSKSKYL